MIATVRSQRAPRSSLSEAPDPLIAGHDHRVISSPATKSLLIRSILRSGGPVAPRVSEATAAGTVVALGGYTGIGALCHSMTISSQASAWMSEVLGTS